MKTRMYRLKTEYTEAMQAAREILLGGGVVAFPTETVYGLGACALQPRAVEKIFLAKGRPQDNPLIVHVASVEQARELAAQWTPLAAQLTEAFWPGPLTVIVPAKDAVPQEVTAGLQTVGLRMPKHADALALIEACGPIAAPSANTSGRPSPTCADHVWEDMQGKIPAILDGGECSYAYESTVVDATGEVPCILRPGGVTKEQIQAVCGQCSVADGVLEQVTGKALSPGMLHRHYAPQGSATLVMPGPEQQTVICSLYDQAADSALIIASEANARHYGNRNMIVCRGDMAGGLFDALRKADEKQVREIIIEGTDLSGTGLAFMNRALRAAGFQTC